MGQVSTGMMETSAAIGWRWSIKKKRAIDSVVDNNNKQTTTTTSNNKIFLFQQPLYPQQPATTFMMADKRRGRHRQ
jgi:hypothetical protein